MRAIAGTAPAAPLCSSTLPAPDPPYDLTSLAARLVCLPEPAGLPFEGPRAAVAAILRDGGDGQDAEILFIRRTVRPTDPWSGHMAFPGGRHDASDPNLLHTAIREAREEVGIDLAAEGNLLARLDDLPALSRGRPAGLVVTPFVFAVRGNPTLVFDADEVDEAIWAPIGPLARGEGAEPYPYNFEGRVIELPSLRIEGRVVWGLTHRMLHMLFEALQRCR